MITYVRFAAVWSIGFGLLLCLGSIVQIGQPAFGMLTIGGNPAGPAFSPMAWLAIGIAIYLLGRLLNHICYSVEKYWRDGNSQLERL